MTAPAEDFTQILQAAGATPSDPEPAPPPGPRLPAPNPAQGSSGRLPALDPADVARAQFFEALQDATLARPRTAH